MFLSEDLQRLVQMLARLPGIGPWSARRITLHLLKNRDRGLRNLVTLLDEVSRTHKECTRCGYLDAHNPCFFCTSSHRVPEVLCVVADTGDVWAFEKAAFFKGRYHVLGGVISPLSGRRPEDLNIETLRLRLSEVQEVILGMDSTLEGQTTLHYLTQKIQEWAPHVQLSSLARGLPIGAELGYMDHGTLQSAFVGRQQVQKVADTLKQWL